jgi:Zn-dependent protease
MLVFAMVAHEYAHGAAALSQGDDTAYMLGRLTLNPVPHIDLWMSILLPALLWFVSHGQFTFGGAKPVPVNPRKYRQFKKGDIIVSAAGVVTNLGIALVCTVLFIAVGLFGAGSASPVLDAAQRMMVWGVWLNLLLCFFNLIPIPPLDGSHLFYYLLPPRLGARYRGLHRWGILPLLAILILLPRIVPGALNLLLTPALVSARLLFGLMVPYQLNTGLHIF